MQPSDFRAQIYNIVKLIPRGRIMTYGQIAALCGKPRAAREVGQIAHFGPTDLPWHRVVNKHGGLARGWPGGIEIHKQLLEADGILVHDYTVDAVSLLWWPQ